MRLRGTSCNKINGGLHHAIRRLAWSDLGEKIIAKMQIEIKDRKASPERAAECARLKVHKPGIWKPGPKGTALLIRRCLTCDKLLATMLARTL